MSKAFTKESESSVGESERPMPESLLPPGTSNYLTPNGAKNLEAELARLITTDRVDAQRRVGKDGDVSAQDAAKRELLEIDRRVRVIQASLAQAEIVDPRGQDPERVLFGAVVTVEDEDERTLKYQIVGIDEADARRNRVSWRSPLAKTLLGHSVGDTVVFRSPRREEELRITNISYERDLG